MSIDSRSEIGSFQPKRDFEKELNQLKLEYIKFLKDKNEHDLVQSKKLLDLQDQLTSVDRERLFWQDKVESLETEYESQFNQMRENHQKELNDLKLQHEAHLQELEVNHRKDKSFLQDLVQRKEGKVVKSNYDSQNYIEMENKYLRDIKELNDSFDEYKKHVEQHIQQITKEKFSLQQKNEELTQYNIKVKRSLRANVNHHEINTKRLKEKVVRLENDNVQLQADVDKYESKIKQLKNQLSKLEYSEKNLRVMLLNKDSVGHGSFMQSGKNTVRSSTVLCSTTRSNTSKAKNKSIDLNTARGQKSLQRCIELELTKVDADDEVNIQQNCQTNLTSLNTYDSTWLTNLNPSSTTLQDKAKNQRYLHSSNQFGEGHNFSSALTPQNNNQIKFTSNNETTQMKFLSSIQSQNQIPQLNEKVSKVQYLSQLTNENSANNKNLQKMIKMLKPINKLLASPSNTNQLRSSLNDFQTSRSLFQEDLIQNFNILQTICEQTKSFQCKCCNLSFEKIAFLGHINSTNNETIDREQIDNFTRSKSLTMIEPRGHGGVQGERFLGDSMIQKQSLQPKLTQLINSPSRIFGTLDEKDKSPAERLSLLKSRKPSTDSNNLNVLQIQTHTDLTQDNEKSKLDLVLLQRQNKHLMKQVAQLKDQLSQLQQVQAQKDKIEKEMQGEIRFLLQQIIQLKDQLQHAQSTQDQDEQEYYVSSFNKRPQSSLNLCVFNTNNQTTDYNHNTRINRVSSVSSILPLGDTKSHFSKMLAESTNKDHFQSGDSKDLTTINNTRRNSPKHSGQNSHSDLDQHHLLSSLQSSLANRLGAQGSKGQLEGGSMTENLLVSVLQEATSKMRRSTEEDFDRTISTIDNQMSEQCNDRENNNAIYINQCTFTPSLHSKSKRKHQDSKSIGDFSNQMQSKQTKENVQQEYFNETKDMNQHQKKDNSIGGQSILAKQKSLSNLKSLQNSILNKKSSVGGYSNNTSKVKSSLRTSTIYSVTTSRRLK